LLNASTPEYLYRFRSLDRLLVKNELESQTIFFASRDKLNDPMEGFLDIFWKGDEILWKNLFRQFLFSLYRVHLLVSLGATSVSSNDVEVKFRLDGLDDKMILEFEKYSEFFFSNQKILTIIEYLSKKNAPVRREELSFYIKSIHPFALSSFSTGAQFNNIFNSEERINVNLDKVIKLLHTNGNSREVDFSFREGFRFDEQSVLIRQVQDWDEKIPAGRKFIVFEFTKAFLEKLETLIYPEWYVACFSENIRNASLWAHYGISHTGVCLRFKTIKNTTNQPAMNIDCITSFSSTKDKSGNISRFKNRGPKLTPFIKVSYDKSYPKVDFFRSIGSLSEPDLMKYWYGDNEGRVSSCAKDIFDDNSQWRTEYWESFRESTAVKLKEWSQETEYRYARF
jgi:hypothetical protein